MKKFKFLLIGFLICFTLLQFIKPSILKNNYLNEAAENSKLMSSVPDSIESIFRSACYDCHSNQTKLEWFDKITPINFVVASDIKKGRKALNFSNFDSLNSKQINASLFYALNKSLSGEMPPRQYTFAHPKSAISNKDLRRIKSYLSSITSRKINDTAHLISSAAVDNQVKQLATKQVASTTPNDIEYIPNYREWKAISITDRFDNKSMRIIYGNDIAIKAIESGHVNPWPDGAILAKTAWQQQVGKDSIIRLGNFIQIEFMIKDSKKYSKTKGWGWARWRGDDLKPYGKGLNFTNECVTCHLPVKENDYVFTAPFNLNTITLSK